MIKAAVKFYDIPAAIEKDEAAAKKRAAQNALNWAKFTIENAGNSTGEIDQQKFLRASNILMLDKKSLLELCEIISE